MSEPFSIVQVPTESLSQLWGAIGPFLIAGAQVDPDVDLEEEVADVVQGRARVWMIVEGDRCVAAFLSSVRSSSDGRALDVYGLGGVGMLRWGKHLTDVMVDYAQIAKCDRVLFKGRKALLRTYPGVRIVGEDSPGTYIYERAL
jgi:hypothetical protein